MVYVIDINGKAMMPTERHGKVRRLLRDGCAVVVRRVPFTIQLLYEIPGGKSRLQRFDTVRYGGKECIISGSTNGRPILKDAAWTKVTTFSSVNSKSVKFLSMEHGSITYQMFNNQHV